jgi:peptidoglycan L-alanyl-D-glutamate endopeptidase CwlK
MTEANSEDTRDQPVVQTTHIAASGESLILIAKQHGVTLKALLDANPQIADPNRINAGQKILVPAGGVTAATATAAAAVALAGVAVGPLPPGGMPPIGAVDSPAFAAMDKRGKTTNLHPVLRQRLAMLADQLAARGMKALITDGLRTFEEQDELFQRGRRHVAGESIVTNARGGESNHNYALAVDMYPVLADAAGKERVFTDLPPNSSVEFARAFTRIQNAIGDEAEELGLFWGARFSGIVDRPHIQLLAEHDLSAKECLKIFRSNGDRLQAVWDEASRRVKPRNASPADLQVT